MNIVRELLRKNGMKQIELAQAIGVSNPTVTDWVRNRKDPRGENLQKLCELFDVDELVLLGVSPMISMQTKEAQTAQRSALDMHLIEMLVKLSPSQLQRVEDFVAGLQAAEATQSSDLP